MNILGMGKATAQSTGEVGEMETRGSNTARRGRRKEAVGPKFGDSHLVFEEASFGEEGYYFERASCQEVYKACCVHSRREWIWRAGAVLFLLFCVYFFVVGMDLIGTSAQVMAGCKAGEIFGQTSNPLTSLMIGIIVTVLLHSSGTATGVIVALTEAKVISTAEGIYLVMGANIGTTITASIVALGHIRRKEELTRGFCAASTHSMFNFMTIAILFPLECATGFLAFVTSELTVGADTSGRDHWEGPIKQIVKPFTDLIIMSNKKVITGVASGKLTCQDFYPITCDDGVESYDTCKVGLISCNKETNACPAFFSSSASLEGDKWRGAASFIIALLIFFLSMAGIVYVTQYLLFGMSTKVVHTVTSSCNGYFAMLIGCGITIFVQSSSLVTSTLVPIAGIGAMQLQTVYPVVLGANVGTAVQAMITALGAIGKAPLQVALSHVFINVIGVMIWYPLPPLRSVPIYASKRLGRGAEIWRLFPVFWLVLMWCVMEIYFIGLSSLFTNGTVSGLAGGIVLVVVTAALMAGLLYWCKWRGGDSAYVAFTDQFSAQTLQENLKQGISYLLPGQSKPLESEYVTPSTSMLATSSEPMPVVENERQGKTKTEGITVSASAAVEQVQTAGSLSLRQQLAMALDEEHGMGVRLAI